MEDISFTEHISLIDRLAISYIKCWNGAGTRCSDISARSCRHPSFHRHHTYHCRNEASLSLLLCCALTLQTLTLSIIPVLARLRGRCLDKVLYINSRATEIND